MFNERGSLLFVGCAGGCVMNDKFDYVYDRGHWLKVSGDDERISKKRIAALTAGFVWFTIGLVGITIAFLSF